MNDKFNRIPEECPKCQSHDILAHLGYAECYNCEHTWSYELFLKALNLLANTIAFKRK